MRVLIVEDRNELADYYLRVFRHVVGADHEYTHVASITSAIDPLFEENWDVILMDSELGPAGRFQKDPQDPAGDGMDIRNGFDLTCFRRLVEKDKTTKIDPSIIIGMTVSSVFRDAFIDAGADRAVSKIVVPAMAHFVKTTMEDKGNV